MSTNFNNSILKDTDSYTLVSKIAKIQEEKKKNSESSKWKMTITKKEV